MSTAHLPHLEEAIVFSSSSEISEQARNFLWAHRSNGFSENVAQHYTLYEHSGSRFIDETKSSTSRCFPWILRCG